MATNKLGDYIVEVNERATKDGSYSLEDIRGISSITKLFQKTKANLVDVSTSGYKIVQSMQFAFNPNTARMGDKIPIALNLENKNVLVSSIYPVFKIIDENKLDPQYLWLWFKRSEFDRYARFKSHGSAREIFSWEEMCNIELEVPSIEQQRSLVEKHNAINKTIDVITRRNRKLESFAKYLLEKELAESKCSANNTFSQLILSSHGGDWGKEIKDGNYTKSVTCFRGTDLPFLQSGLVEDAPIRYILPKNFEKKRINSGDLIIEISGGSPVQSTGRIAMVSDLSQRNCDNSIICSNFCRVLSVDDDYKYFFYTYWKKIYDDGIMFGYENSSTGLKNFDYDAFINEQPIIIPKDNHLENKLKCIYSAIDNNGSLMAKLDSLSRLLMPNHIGRIYNSEVLN